MLSLFVMHFLSRIEKALGSAPWIYNATGAAITWWLYYICKKLPNYWPISSTYFIILLICHLLLTLFTIVFVTEKKRNNISLALVIISLSLQGITVFLLARYGLALSKTLLLLIFSLSYLMFFCGCFTTTIINTIQNYTGAFIDETLSMFILWWILQIALMMPIITSMIILVQFFKKTPWNLLKTGLFLKLFSILLTMFTVFSQTISFRTEKIGQDIDLKRFGKYKVE